MIVEEDRMPAKPKDITGMRSGMLVAEKIVGKRGKSNLWQCRCDCGSTTNAVVSSIIRGEKTSCGCKKKHKRKQRPDLSKRNIDSAKHGMVGSREYNSWRSMKYRCENPDSKDYPLYGGRGISVFKEWSQSFEAFYEYMGPRPHGKSLDRIDPNGNYEPGNVRWANDKKQSNNKRTNTYIEINGETKTVTEWAREYGLEPKTVAYRIKAGWSAIDALSTEPIIKRK